MLLLKAIEKYGLLGVANRLPRYFLDDLSIREFYLTKTHKKNEIYKNPTNQELIEIEDGLKKANIAIDDYEIDIKQYQHFLSQYVFPEDYHGGRKSGVWDEKMLEHFNAYKILKLNKYGSDDIYLDIAACNSPWAQLLRENGEINSHALDLEVPDKYKHLNYYEQCNATNTKFKDNSVRGISLQCAFEMFVGDDDICLVDEFSRILKPGGMALINPLYMHTHYCCYASSEYYQKGYNDPNSKEYLHPGVRGIPSSRKYDVKTLKKRILSRITDKELRYQLLALRNKSDISTEIYCHFLLLIHKDYD